MFNLLKQLLLFKTTQSSTRGLARMLGFGRLATIVGLVAGVRALRNHRRHA